MLNLHTMFQANRPIFPIVISATLTASQGALAPLTALGIVTATGNLAVLNSANSDGSQTLAAILVEAAPNSGSTQTVQVAIANLFVSKASLVFGGSDTYSTHFNSIGQAKSGVDFYVY
jgi:Bacteriophage lambda head decoration protein D